MAWQTATFGDPPIFASVQRQGVVPRAQRGVVQKIVHVTSVTSCRARPIGALRRTKDSLHGNQTLHALQTQPLKIFILSVSLIITDE
jgi:hypothetical protein